MRSKLDPGRLDAGDSYKLLIGLVVPRAIGWIGTRGDDGVDNLAPFSFYTAVAATPPSIIFSTIRPDGQTKDSLSNVRRTGAFTVNVVTEEIAEEMNASAASVSRDVDEFLLAGLNKGSADLVDAPFVDDAKAVMECQLIDTVDVGRPPMAGTIVIGEIVRFHVEESLLDGTKVDQLALRAIGRMGGPLFTRTQDTFSLTRPE